ncbi:MAG: flavodoxin family protein [Butyricicoccus sp.]
MTKRVCVLLGSPRRNGNTEQLARQCVLRLEELGAACEVIRLHGKDLRPCLACRQCQQDWTRVGCVQKDEMQPVFDAVLRSDLVLFVSPIYSWYCTAPTKVVMDRLIYGCCKYYGDKRGPSLLADKRAAIVTTCGYPPERGADLWAQGVQRYCKHAQMTYLGMLAERHRSYAEEFMNEEKAQRAREFAERLFAAMDGASG